MIGIGGRGRTGIGDMMGRGKSGKITGGEGTERNKKHRRNKRSQEKKFSRRTMKEPWKL
jgi:hypothetical protein